LIGVALVIYVVLNFATTSVKPQGTGGLSGPMRVRVYYSEYHVALFYPVYLVERWVRNGDLFRASTYFNCDFGDQVYAHEWMYGDDKYSSIWYSHGDHFLSFFVLAACFAAGFWRLAKFPIWPATAIGFVCGTLVAFGYCSYEATRMWEWEISHTPSHFGRSVLWLTVTDAGGKVERGYRNSLHATGSSFFKSKDFSAELMTVSANGFKVEFRQARRDTNALVGLIDFPYGVTTKTNWNQFQIEGAFPWYRPDIWTNSRHKNAGV
jgi:hypothetical protein